ncbi:MAG: condensation domain-containing protein, partial [Verrucomicrobiota bacterium]
MQNASQTGFRLSPQQQQLFISQRGNPSAYCAQCAVLIEGKLDRLALMEALNKVVQRHEILRTTFQRSSGMKMPLQFINDPVLPPLQEIDLSTSRPSEQESKIEEYLRKDGSDPQDLEQSPLLRLALFAMSIDRHVLTISLPSLCADGRSLSYLVLEIAHFYSPESSTVTIPEEPLQYADFSEWQNSTLESEDEGAQSGKAYWVQQALDALPPMALCFAGKGDSSKEWAPNYCVLKLGLETASKVELLAGALGTSTERCLLAAWQALLWRLVGQSEVLVSFVPADRNHEEIVGALGLFARALPIRLSLEREPKFVELVADVDKAVTAAFQSQDYLPVIENCSEVDPAHRPIQFEFDDRRGHYSAAGVNFSIYRKSCATDRFNLKLVCIRAEEGLTLEFHFDASIFRLKDVERFAEYFRQLIEQSISNSAGAIGTLELLRESDRQQLLVAFNQTAAEYPKEKTLHKLFEEQVERTPNRLALVCGEAQLTYAQLNVQANQLANYLRRLGVGANVCVGLCVERSAEMIIGLLGILKAGGAYLPLQPDNPKARLAHLLSETKAPLLLTQEKLLSQLPNFTGETICFEKVRTKLQGEATTNPQSVNSSDDLVYVIYTSGSTGTPKGVATRHRNLVNYATFIVNKLRSTGTPTSEGLQFAT